jgi:hypothetical protein
VVVTTGISSFLQLLSVATPARRTIKTRKFNAFFIILIGFKVGFNNYLLVRLLMLTFAS